MFNLKNIIRIEINYSTIYEELKEDVIDRWSESVYRCHVENVISESFFYQVFFGCAIRKKWN